MDIENITKEELYELYVTQNNSLLSLSKTFNVSIDKVRKYLKKYSIKKEVKKFDITKEELYELYIIQDLSTIEIGKIKGFNKSTVQDKLKKYNIEKGLEQKEKKRIDNLNKAMSKLTQEDVYKSIEKRKQTCLKKYGVEYTLQSKEIRERIKQTCIEKYGVDNPLKNDEIKEKTKKTCMEKYGVDNVFKSDFFQNKADKTMIERYGVKNPSQNKYINQKASITSLEKYGVPYTCMTMNCRSANRRTISKVNIDFSEKLDKKGIENDLEFPIESKSFDIKIRNKNILIEINPTYSHNSTCNFWVGKSYNQKPKSKDYHYLKTLLAIKNNYRCIHIWDWDDISKVIDLLKPKTKKYARKLQIKEIEPLEADIFLQEYHLQGKCQGNIVNIGLYEEGKLIQVMTFGKPRYNKKYEWELLRLCTHSEYIVIGGTERMYSFFQKKYNPKSVISYCDNSKFLGNVYLKLGFTLKSYGQPSKHWYNVKTKRHITDNLLRQRGFDQLFKTNYGKGTSNEELMIKEGFFEIFDCGQSIYTKE